MIARDIDQGRASELLYAVSGKISNQFWPRHRFDLFKPVDNWPRLPPSCNQARGHLAPRAPSRNQASLRGRGQFLLKLIKCADKCPRADTKKSPDDRNIILQCNTVSVYNRSWAAERIRPQKTLPPARNVTYLCGLS